MPFLKRKPCLARKVGSELHVRFLHEVACPRNAELAEGVLGIFFLVNTVGGQCRIFETVTVFNRDQQITFTAKDQISFESKDCVFIFAIDCAASQDVVAQAVIFTFAPDTPQFAPLSKLRKTSAAQNSPIEADEFKIMKDSVRQFLRDQMVDSEAVLVDDQRMPRKTREPRNKAKKHFSPPDQQDIISRNQKKRRGNQNRAHVAIQKSRKTLRLGLDDNSAANDKQNPANRGRRTKATRPTRSRRVKQGQVETENSGSNSDLSAKMDAVLELVGNMKKEVDDLKMKSSLEKGSETQATTLGAGLPFLGIPQLPPSSLTVLPAQRNPSGESGSEMLQAMKLMAAVTYMQSVNNFMR